jgi:chromosome segregation ATPase
MDKRVREYQSKFADITDECHTIKSELEDRNHEVVISRQECSELQRQVDIYERELRTIVDLEKAKVRDQLETLNSQIEKLSL